MSRVSRVLSHLSEEAKKGVITTVTQIKRAIEAQIGQTVHPTTIYRLLERHQWRKVMPVTTSNNCKHPAVAPSISAIQDFPLPSIAIKRSPFPKRNTCLR